MTMINEHPTVVRYREQGGPPLPASNASLDYHQLRELCLTAGADDVGFVSLERSELEDQRQDILALFPHAKTLISIVSRMNREPVRSPARTIANMEFHHASEHVDEVGHHIVKELEACGIRARNPAAGFPMEMKGFPGKVWVVSHKPVAVAAGLGRMGIHRNVIHPRFGNFILLGTIIVDAPVNREDRPIDYNPCLECKLCVAACPVGAIGSDGHFNFSSCYTHNYREFMSGFSDWVETVVTSDNIRDYRSEVSLSETTSWWQSLSFGANYKAAYCMSVCPAGEDVIGPFLTDRKEFLQNVVRPLRESEETIYVTAGSDAEEHVLRHFPNKTVKRVGNGLRVPTIDAFINALPHIFQRKQAAKLDLHATFHFTFTGSEERLLTVHIDGSSLEVHREHVGKATIRIEGDSRTWLAFLAKEQNIVLALLRRKIRVKGKPNLLLSFGKCFGA